MVKCLTTAGAAQDHARQMADVLIEGDVRGHYSHGLNRLGGKVVIYVFYFTK